MNITSLLLVGTILLITTSVTSVATAQDNRWYVGGGFGKSDDDALDDEDDGLKVFGGFQFHKHVAVEAAFVDLGEFDIISPMFGPGTLEQDGVAIQAVGLWPLGERWLVFGKAGVFSWDVEAFGLSDDGSDATFGVGGAYDFGNKWAVRAEWERFEDVSGGDVDLISASFVYRFGKPGPRARKQKAPEKVEPPAPKPTPETTTPRRKEVDPPELAAAQRGDANAQYKLGYRYSTGSG
ncbi:MAG: porin family protein, partial [Acidiferrobacterales bacterium]